MNGLPEGLMHSLAASLALKKETKSGIPEGGRALGVSLPVRITLLALIYPAPRVPGPCQTERTVLNRDARRSSACKPEPRFAGWRNIRFLRRLDWQETRPTVAYSRGACRTPSNRRDLRSNCQSTYPGNATARSSL